MIGSAATRLNPWLGPAAAVLLLCVAALPAAAQDLRPPLGTVELGSATVSGALEVSDGRAVVRGGGSITAHDRTAELRLNRGGVVAVCSTSSLHITSGNDAAGPSPLLLALDRGAMEIRTTTTPRDVVITPDLRFSITGTGPLDLHLRVTPNGDTCVDNRGLQAPTLEIINQFGDERYQLRAGQHVLFEHGSLHEVVDHESSPCGCPATPAVSVASAPLSSPQSVHPAATAALPGTRVDPETQLATPPGGSAPPPDTAAQHPFPAAESQGLAPENPAATVPQAAPGQPHAQVAATLAFGEGATATTAPSSAAGPEPPANRPSGAAAAPAPSPAGASPPSAAASPSPAPVAPGAAPPAPPATPLRAEAPPPPPAPPAHDFVHALGRFFRRLFGGRP